MIKKETAAQNSASSANPLCRWMSWSDGGGQGERGLNFRHRVRNATTEENLNGGLGRMVEFTRDTAGATQSLSCGTTDCDHNEAKYLQEAVDLLERLHRRGTRRGGSEITLVERSR